MLPAHNTVVIFSRPPNGSYCRPGTPYRVERTGRDVRFTGPSGASTSDRAAVVARTAVWRTLSVGQDRSAA